ncbi:hypothetical protein V8G54_017337 [Vigna mungo]|uniref:pyruvate kinase n=1 Tax=Vigna mungo TaxID=3915 RepID=A0AAQ3NPB1_VIGMU
MATIHLSSATSLLFQSELSPSKRRTKGIPKITIVANHAQPTQISSSNGSPSVGNANSSVQVSDHGVGHAGPKSEARKKTKIVCTIGPSTSSRDMIWSLAEAGMNVARLNMSHGDHASHLQTIELVREYNAQFQDKVVAIMLDTKDLTTRPITSHFDQSLEIEAAFDVALSTEHPQDYCPSTVLTPQSRGPEVRSGDVPQPISLKEGQEFYFTTRRGVSTESTVSVNYDDFVNDVEVGDVLLVDGGMMSLAVKSKTKDLVKCEVIDGGELKSRRHLNVRGKSATLPSITDKDWEDIKFGVDNQVDFYAVSFVKDARVVCGFVHMLEVPSFLVFIASLMGTNNHVQPCHNADIHVIVKIESADSISNLHSILSASDGWNGDSPLSSSPATRAGSFAAVPLLASAVAAPRLSQPFLSLNPLPSLFLNLSRLSSSFNSSFSRQPWKLHFTASTSSQVSMAFTASNDELDKAKLEQAMVARGDLGAELPIEEVPLLQEDIIRRCQSMQKPVIVATNMLESMINHPTPTRAEVSDIAIAVRQGADAIMLSGETAHGKFPLKAVKVMHTVALRNESSVQSGAACPSLSSHKSHMGEMFAFHATTMSNTLNTPIIVFTRTGSMAILLSHYRPYSTIFAFTNEKRIKQRLALYHGVVPIYMQFSNDAEETFSRALELLLSKGHVHQGQHVTLVQSGAQPIWREESTHHIQVRKVHE